MRPIDADALKEKLSSLSVVITGLRSGKGVLSEFMEECRKSILRSIDEQATVDPESLRPQGEWCFTNEEGFFIAECSVCGMVADATRAAVWDYCPNCGAGMTGKERHRGGSFTDAQDDSKQG